MIVFVQVGLYLYIDHILFVDNVQSKSLDDAKDKAIERETYLLQHATHLAGVLSSIAGSDEFVAYQQGERGKIERFFLWIAQNHKDIYQLRYIDAKGMEKIRIDRKTMGQEAYIVKDLQDKSDRDYFQQARLAKADQLSYSDLDLNVEHGKVEVPYVPVIRIMFPLQKEGEFDGLLIVNVFMKDVLDKFFNTGLYDMILCDSEGYPIIHHNSEFSWGRYQSRPYRIMTEFGEVGRELLQSDFFRSETLVSQRLKLPYRNTLYLILQLNGSYLQQMEEQEFHKAMVVLGFFFVSSFIFAFFLSYWVILSFRRVRAAQKMAEEAGRAKAQFLANMSHEIRTPLNGMMGLTNLVLRSELNPQQRAYLTQAMGSSKMLMNVINDILDFSKIEAGKMDLESIPFILESTIKEVLFLFKSAAQEKGIELHIDLDKELLGSFEGDPNRLKQILSNLLSNAIKFTDQGDITIISKVVEEDETQVEVKFCVEDTGIGIEQAKVQTLFEAFTQNDASDSRRYGGTGLGLSISKALSEMMGGRIWAESTLGKGSRFCFTVILKRNMVELRHRIVFDSIQHKRFLVVDDNAIERRIISDILNSWKVEHTLCSNGKEALEVAKTEVFDYILIDWKMPEIDGLQVIQELRLAESVSNIIMVTAFEKEALIKEAEAMGLSVPPVLMKPVSASDIFDLLSLKKENDVEVTPDKGVIRGRVLVAEDNAVNQIVIRDMLEYYGCEVVIAENGYRAVSLAKNGDFDLIFMDIQMPRMNGYEAAKAILDSDENIPIIALSAAVMEGDQMASKAAGMREHLGKPIDEAHLKEILLRYLQPDVERKREKEVSAEKECKADLKGHLLVAEDNKTNQHIIAAHLEDLGISFEIVENGKEALKKALEKPYDLILMDIQMPQMNGLDAARRIKEEGVRIPVIALSATCDLEDKNKAAEAGMDDYLCKPFEQAQLRALLSRYLRTHAGGAYNEEAEGMPVAVDMQQGLKQLRGKKTLYIEVLQKFCEMVPGIVMEIDDAIDREEYPVVANKMHALRGSSSMIGAVALYGFTSEWEEKLTAGEVPQNKEHLKEELNTITQESYEKIGDIIEQLKGEM